MRNVAVAGGPSAHAHGSTNGSLHWVVILKALSPAKSDWPMKITLALVLCHIANCPSVFWCFGHHEIRKQSTTSWWLPWAFIWHQNKSRPVFWWFGHVLEQTLCIPFTRPTHFSLFKGIAAIPEQNQTNDALPSWEWIPCLSQTRDCHVGPSTWGASDIWLELLTSSPTGSTKCYKV